MLTSRMAIFIIHIMILAFFSYFSVKEVNGDRVVVQFKSWFSGLSLASSSALVRWHRIDRDLVLQSLEEMRGDLYGFGRH